MTTAPVQRFVESQRVRIACWDWGNEGAPPLVLVHGGRDHSRSWDRTAEALRDRYHVVAFDLRGHGDSDWTPGGNYGLPDNALDLVRVIESVGSPARVIAHSYGGSVSLVAAGAYPEHFASLVVIEGTHSLNPGEDDRVGPAWVRRWGDRLRSFETQEPRVYADLESAEQRMKEANPRLPADILPGLAGYASRAVEGGLIWKYDLWVNDRTSMELRRSELPAFWEAITCPVLLLLGGESASRRRQHPAPENHIRGLRTVEIPEAGHWIHHDQPGAFLREVDAFLGSVG